MSAVLLDVNLLLALLDPAHVDHELADSWFGDALRRPWATCALTQNGYLRIASQSRYTNPAHIEEAVDLLDGLTAFATHEFWPDEVSMLDETLFNRAALGSAARVTDSYLLGLAVSRGGRLATLDRKLRTSAVAGGDDALIVVA